MSRGTVQQMPFSPVEIVIRHFPVYEAYVVTITTDMGFLHNLHGFRTAEHPSGTKSHFIQQQAGVLAGIVVVIHYEHFEWLQLAFAFF